MRYANKTQKIIVAALLIGAVAGIVARVFYDDVESIIYKAALFLMSACFFGWFILLASAVAKKRPLPLRGEIDTSKSPRQYYLVAIIGGLILLGVAVFIFSKII